MKVLIVSDTHGKEGNLKEAIRREQPIDMLIHCGDVEGGEEKIRQMAGCPVHMVAGNNDFFCDLPREKEFEIGKYRVLLTHGHYYYISMGTEMLKEEAKARSFGSYMKKDVSIEESTKNVEIFDTAIAIMAGLMIIPAVFAFSGGDPDTLQAGPALMFITIPRVFDSMGMGTVVGVLFFLLVLFAAMTSSIALTESAVSTFEDELGWGRKKATVMIGIIMLALGTLSSLGYGPLAAVKIIGMQFLDFFDFLTNSVMMPIAAVATCLLVSRVIGVKGIEEEVLHGEQSFKRKKIFRVMIQYLGPVFAVIILLSSVANAFGWISM